VALQKKLEVSVSRSIRQGWIEWDKAELSVKAQAELLSLNRTSLYYKSKGPSEREVQLTRRIDEIYTASPFYGSRKIRAQLCREGWQVNRKLVQRLMRQMGLEAICPKPNLSKPGAGQEHQVYPYLLRHFKLEKPTQLYGIDITYIRLRGGWLYLVALIDWYSRYVVGWELDQSLEIEFVLRAVKRALEAGAPEIINSDQGSHFTSSRYTELLSEAGVKISMDGKGRAFDNIFTERLWRTVKYECVYLHEFESPKEARRVIGEYLDFYNNRRLHAALDYHTPAEVHFGQVKLVG
jgi:putative transposase